MANDEAPTIIIKKKKGGGGEGHHGGAWKVAYADFVTAMMAFFLLMWLLSATSEEQRKGIAEYFSPSIPISEDSSGGRSMFGGESVVSSDTLRSDGNGGEKDADKKGEGEQDGVALTAPDPDDVDPFLKAVAQARAELEYDALRQQLREARSTAATDARVIAKMEAELAETRRALAQAAAENGEMETADAAAAGRDGEDLAAGPEAEAETAAETGTEAEPVDIPPAPEPIHVTDRAALERALADPSLSDSEREAMRAAFEAIQDADPQGDLLAHLNLRMTPEGLLIEIAETAKTPLFASGSAQPAEVMVQLMAAIAPAIAPLQNRVAITGHTDARPFANGSRRNNWTLSTERADAARRLLVAFGLPPAHMARISGAADRDPLSEDAYAPENRRIGLTLLRVASKRPRPSDPAEAGPEAESRSNGGGSDMKRN